MQRHRMIIISTKLVSSNGTSSFVALVYRRLDVICWSLIGDLNQWKSILITWILCFSFHSAYDAKQVSVATSRICEYVFVCWSIWSVYIVIWIFMGFSHLSWIEIEQKQKNVQHLNWFRAWLISKSKMF